jgi:hypothetical protein
LFQAGQVDRKVDDGYAMLLHILKLFQKGESFSPIRVHVPVAGEYFPERQQVVHHFAEVFK